MANSVFTLPILITSLIQATVVLNVFGDDVTAEPSGDPKSFNRPGDYVIGGLFDIHFFSVDGKGGPINPLSLQWMYAMVYAIEKINNRTDLLPNVTIGFDIHDTRADANIAVSNSLDFITTNSECESSSSSPEENSVIAVVGPRTNNAAVDTANFFNLFKVPQVSYAATTNLLSDSQYEYFLRTVPSVEAQVGALLDVISYHNWTTVILLYTDDFAFGRSTRQIFVEQSAKMKICIALSKPFRIDSSPSELSDIGRNIREFKYTRVIVAIAEESPMLKLLSQFLIDGLRGYVWLGTDSWTVSTQLVSPAFFPVVKGMLGIVSHSNLDESFHDYLREVRVRASPKGGGEDEDPFLTEYWEEQLNCTFTHISDWNEMGRCDNQKLSTTDPFFDDVPVGSVFDAVETIARGLHSVLSCTSSSCHGQYTVSEGHLLLKAMNRSTFSGHSGNVVSFTATGDMASPAWYDIKNLVPLENSSMIPNGKWTIVSSWRDWTLSDFSVVRWPTSDDLMTTVTPPLSFCSQPCSPGERLTNLDTNICCWNCTECGENSYSDVENSNVCLPCGTNQSSNANRTRCDDFRKVFLEVSSFSGIVIAVSGIAGLLISMMIFITLVLKKVHGSFSRYGEAIFVVCVTSFLASFLCFVRPTTLSCRFVAVVQPMPATVLSTLLIIVSYSMYNSKRRLIGKTILWLGASVTLQLVTVTIWIITGGPEPYESVVRSEGSAYVSCDSPGDLPGHFMILLYQIVLDLLGAVFSFSLRMNKDNFYEGKFIFSTFVVHSMVWIAVSLMYLLLPSEKHARPVLLSQCLTVSGYIYVGSLFVPKLYALKYKPYMLRKRSVSRERQQWKFKRKYTAGKKSSNRRKIYLRGCKRTIRTLKDETGFINSGIKLITESFTTTYEQQIFKHLQTFGNLHDLKINIIINSSNLTGTQL